jgi:NitT/TauT family transport system ATP-binding protein
VFPKLSAVLSIQDLSKRFLSRGVVVRAVDNVSLDIQDGEFVTIVGPSGCGKSTLLNILAGLFPPSSGEIRFEGRRVLGLNPEIGYVTQQDNLLPWRTLRKNVLLPIEFREGSVSHEVGERASALIRKVGLGGFEHHYPHELSGGMRQRANIIRTLVYNPRVILMDEPFGPLDAQTRLTLQNQLLQLWGEERKTIVFITHDLTEAIALADRVVVMTGRPGTVKSVTRIAIPRPRDVYHIHHSEAYREVYDKLWEELRTEVAKVM